MTSSAMRPASRPTRVGSSVTVPWKRVGFAASGLSGGISSVPDLPPGSGVSPPGTGSAGAPPGPAGRGLSASSCRRATSGLTSNPGASVSGNETTCPPRSPRYRFASSSKLFRDRKRIVLPGEKGDPVRDRVQENRWIADPRQIEIARKILDDLLDRHVIAAPERHAIELHPQARGGKAGHEQLIALELLARSARQRVLARQPHGQPLDWCLGTGLIRNQEFPHRRPMRWRAGNNGCRRAARASGIRAVALGARPCRHWCERTRPGVWPGL